MDSLRTPRDRSPAADLWKLCKVVPGATLQAEVEPVSVEDFDARGIPELCRRLCYLVSSATDESGESAALGLAAPQLGISLPVVAMKASGPGTFAMVNPEIREISNEVEVEVERCFSTGPDKKVRVRRARRVTISYLDERGLTRGIELEGLAARVAQHEIDHLHGTLITDRAQP